MKKHEILKILGITFIIGFLLTWLIPAGQFTESGFQPGELIPLGFIDFFKVPLSAVANFVYYGMFFLILGGLYGVMNKTGVYSLIVDEIVKKVKSKEQKFLIFTIIFFVVISSLLGTNYLIFTLIPFFVAVLLLIGYSKITAFVTTIGSILIGNLGSTYGNDINNWLKYFFGNPDTINKIDEFSVHNQMIARVIFLIIITVLFALLVIKKTQDELKEVKEEKTNKKGKKEALKIPLYTGVVKKERNPLPLIIICSFTFLVLLLGMFDWEVAFGVKYFAKMHETIMSAKSNGYPIIANLIGSIDRLGNWNIYDLTVILMILTVLLAWIYSVSLKDSIDAFKDGAKEMLAVAFYATMANVLFSLIYFSQTGANFFNTSANFLLGMTSSLNVVTMSLSAIFGSLFYNNFLEFSHVFNMITVNFYNNSLLVPAIALILQFMHGLVMLVAPTSILLIAGLLYLDVSYKEWIKYIWKYLLKVLLIALVVIIIIMMFI